MGVRSCVHVVSVNNSTIFPIKEQDELAPCSWNDYFHLSHLLFYHRPVHITCRFLLKLSYYPSSHNLALNNRRRSSIPWPQTQWTNQAFDHLINSQFYHFIISCHVWSVQTQQDLLLPAQYLQLTGCELRLFFSLDRTTNRCWCWLGWPAKSFWLPGIKLMDVSKL